MGRKLQQAVKDVDSYIEPHDCFVWFMNSREGYAPIPGTPCAHYVSHQLGMTREHPSDQVCAEKYLIRVEDVVARLDKIEVGDVQVGDVWARLKHAVRTGGGKEPTTHCGLVSKVDTSGDTPKITIKHCSSGQKKVAENDWTQFFAGGGAFYRLPARAKNAEQHANLQRFRKGFGYRRPFTSQV
jgi:hypothetical protein